jgi:hypothetical protein
MLKWVALCVVVACVPLAQAAASPEKYAYATFFYGEEDTAASLLATRVLLSSLRRSGTLYPVVVLVPPTLPRAFRDVLELEGGTVRAVAGFTVPTVGDDDVQRALIHFRNKLLLWTLSEFTRVVLLDSDDLGALALLLPFSARARVPRILIVFSV